MKDEMAWGFNTHGAMRNDFNILVKSSKTWTWIGR
jgi:hypothetical protein